MTIRERKYFSRVTLVCLALAGLVFAGTVLVFSSPDLFRRFSAWHMGAHYLGVKGVELQVKYNDCGPTSLKMVLDHFAIPATAQKLGEQIGLTRRGASMLALKEAAERKGLCANGWWLNPKDLLGTPFPAIILVHADHFVVVDSISPQRWVYVRDPAVGRLRISLHLLAGMWHGETLVFTKKMDHEARERKRQTLARWSAGDNQTRHNPQTVPCGVLQEGIAGRWDAAGRATNPPFDGIF